MQYLSIIMLWVSTVEFYPFWNIYTTINTTLWKLKNLQAFFLTRHNNAKSYGRFFSLEFPPGIPHENFSVPHPEAKNSRYLGYI